MQKQLKEFISVKHVFVPIEKTYKDRKGVSERILKRRLEKQGWDVWRGGLFSIVRKEEVYPNVMKRYRELCHLIRKYHPRKLEILQYMCDVHHGLPDFICFRRGKLKFVECKLGHEQLSHRQKVCIGKLMDLGFKVEVHKLVEPCTKARVVYIDLKTGEKEIIEKQTTLRGKL